MFLAPASRSQLATEEELESVINLLSGVGCGSVSPMQVIPEIVSPQGSMQLTVPQIYRMPSPLSDSHLDDLRAQKSQVNGYIEFTLLSCCGDSLKLCCLNSAARLCYILEYEFLNLSL